jgi:hypothetical protein
MISEASLRIFVYTSRKKMTTWGKALSRQLSKMTDAQAAEYAWEILDLFVDVAEQYERES